MFHANDSRNGGARTTVRASRGGILVLVLSLAACGGGATTGATPDSPTSGSPPQALSSVTIEVTTASGTPLPGVGVYLNGGFDGKAADSDDTGRVHFDKIPAGPASVGTYVRGYHSASRRFNVSSTATEVTVILEPVGTATPVVLGTHATPALDGTSVVVDVDVAVLGEDGQSIPTLRASDFSIFSSDCGFNWCVMDAAGQPRGGYYAHVDPDDFAWTDASFDSISMATAVLLEDSDGMAQFDPGHLRLGALKSFLGSMTAPDLVSVASYRGTPQAPVLTSYGPFSSDGALFATAVDGLAADTLGPNPMYEGVSEMLARTVEQALAGPGAARRSLVIVAGGGSWPDDTCGTSSACRQAIRLALADQSLAANIPIVAIGGSEPAADLAARTGGVAVTLADPVQYAIVLENLKAIATRGLGHNRVRIVLDAPINGGKAPSVFRSGHTVWATMSVRIGPDTDIYLPVVIPIE